MPPSTASSPAHEDVAGPDLSTVVTDDDAPVDNFPSEKQQRLLTEPLYSSWSGPPAAVDEAPRPFLAAAKVGLFAAVKEPPLVPDVMLALDVEVHPDWWEKERRSYFFWDLGQIPDVVIEIASNRSPGALDFRLRQFASKRIAYYVVLEPSRQLGGSRFRAYELRGHRYVPLERAWFEAVGLGLTEWEGTYEGQRERWLRWCRADGTVVPTGAERADTKRERAERLAARLRALGIDPEAT